MRQDRPPTAAPSRRQATRAATVAAIKAAALRQISQEGAPAVSIRGIARTVGLSPAGMYRYYDSRDALLTDLLVDAYNDLADAVAAAAGLPSPPDRRPAPDGQPSDVLRPLSPVADPVGSLLRAIEAYRTWAVADPSRFLLLFGTPVPGYAAPEEGPTVEANRRMGRVFFTLGALAWRGGPDGLQTDTVGRPPTQEELALLAQLRLLVPDLPAVVVPRMLAGWALWHGMVTLEVTGQLQWAYPDSGGYFTETMRTWVEDFIAGR